MGKETKNNTNGKRESIICAAVDLFFTKGYANTKIIEIAESANIGKGTFYEYFSSKESLLEELLDLKFTKDKETLDSIYSSLITGEEKIKGFMRLEIEGMNNYGPSSNVLAKEMMSSSFNYSDEVKLMIHKMFMCKYNFIKNVIENGIKNKEFRSSDPSLAAVSLIGSISLYTAFKFDFMNHQLISGIPFGNPNWNDEEFFDLIFMGLK